LRRAVVLEPDFAKGWAALATVLAMLARSDQDRIEAERDARHALALDSELAEAHAALGMILRFTGAEARAHLKRAVALNPRDPQTLFWLANHYATMLEFEPRMEALRRAVALDPYWARGANEAAVAAWQLGNRDEARRYAERLASYNREQALDCEFRLDLADGAYASIVRKLMLARSRSDSPATGDAKLGSALLILGRVEPARMLLHLRPYQWTVASGGLPSPAEFREVEMGSAADWFDSHDFLDLSMQRLLAGGRASELVARFEAGGPGNLSQLARRTDDRSLLVAFAPDMALALRAVGRARDADALLSRTDAELRRVYAAGPVPDWVDAGLARLRAAQGRRTEALAALARAIDRGWHYAPLTPMPDIANLYAFRSLQGDPRFEALRHQLLDRLERERRSLGATSV
jgi:tetratricopeptide (TPR) repeat protein